MKTRPNRRVQFLGCPVDCLTSRDLLEQLKDGVIARHAPKVIQFVNANKIAMVRRDAAMGSILQRSDYVLADGQPMLPMAAMLGFRIPERIDGIGLMHKLLGLAHREHFSVYLLGARQEILEECVRRIGREFPGLTVAGFRNGYFTESEIPTIAAGIRETAPDFLFLGIGSPLKERLADEWKDAFGARVIQGVGGSFDVMAGMVKRAPMWMQRSCMEWLYRVIQEPRRMFWRYVKTNGSCLWVFFKAFGNRWLKPSLPLAPTRAFGDFDSGGSYAFADDWRMEKDFLSFQVTVGPKADFFMASRSITPSVKSGIRAAKSATIRRIPLKRIKGRRCRRVGRSVLPNRQPRSR